MYGLWLEIEDCEEFIMGGSFNDCLDEALYLQNREPADWWNIRDAANHRLIDRIGGGC